MYITQEYFDNRELKLIIHIHKNTERTETEEEKINGKTILIDTSKYNRINTIMIVET